MRNSAGSLDGGWKRNRPSAPGWVGCAIVSTASPTRPPISSGRPFLVVDDDHDIRETLAGVLADDGHSVMTATDGFDALQKLAQLSRPGRVKHLPAVGVLASGACESRALPRQLAVNWILARQSADTDARRWHTRAHTDWRTIVTPLLAPLRGWLVLGPCFPAVGHGAEAAQQPVAHVEPGGSHMLRRFTVSLGLTAVLAA